MAFAPSLVWLFATRMLTGIFGATNGPSQSVIADVTGPDDRSRLFGYISAAFGVGFVAGPALGGLLAEFDPRLPFYAASALAAANFVYGAFALPETLAKENRRAFDWKRANPVGALLTVRKLPGLLPISAVYLAWQLASLIYPMTWSYFTIGRYGWSNAMIGLSLALMGVSMALTQIVFSSRIIARFGERRTATIGMLGGALGMIGFAVTTNGWLAFAMMPFLAVQSLVHPCLTAMMSRRANATKSGRDPGLCVERHGCGVRHRANGLQSGPVLVHRPQGTVPILWYCLCPCSALRAGRAGHTPCNGSCPKGRSGNRGLGQRPSDPAVDRLMADGIERRSKGSRTGIECDLVRRTDHEV